jgi:hypothetical protein
MKYMKWMGLYLAWFGFGAVSASGQTWDAKADFSAAQNPSGSWSYGWSTELAGPLTIFPNYLANGGGEEWVDYSILQSAAPNLIYNTSSINFIALIPPLALSMHPGPGNQFTHCRWTAAESGTYNIQGSFTPVDYGGPHGYILKNGTSIGDSLLTEGVEKDYSFNSVVLAAGDTIEAVGGVGADDVFYNDQTDFSLTITKVTIPPPTVYDAKADFSTTLNPSGPWSYGWSTELAGPLTLFPNYLVFQGGDKWQDDSILQSGCPNLVYNPSSTTFTGLIPPLALSMHPGPGNQFTHCRWTAAESGTYNIQGSFTPVDYGGPHGYILKNGTSLGDSILTEGVEKDYILNSVVMAAGDTIEAVVGVGADDVFYNDQTDFSLTITPIATGTGTVPPPVGPAVAGSYRGLFNLAGASGPAGGMLTATVAKSGAFTAVLQWAGRRVTLKGSLAKSGVYSSVITLSGGIKITLSLSFDTNGNLTGSVTEYGDTYQLAASGVSADPPEAGYYTFILTPEPAAGAPEGTGFGYMYVQRSGAVSLFGSLGDGTQFSASSRVTAGNTLAIYADPYKSDGSGISGNLVFRHILVASDCDGTLVWSRSEKGARPGFETAVYFQAALMVPPIVGLNGDNVSFDARGADLGSEVTADVTLHPSKSGLPLIGGTAANLSLSILPVSNYFFGSFTDPSTNKRQLFSGVLLPTSRSGAGLFFSGGSSGTVEIGY